MCIGQKVYPNDKKKLFFLQCGLPHLVSLPLLLSAAVCFWLNPPPRC